MFYSNYLKFARESALNKGIDEALLGAYTKWEY